MRQTRADLGSQEVYQGDIGHQVRPHSYGWSPNVDEHLPIQDNLLAIDPGYSRESKGAGLRRSVQGNSSLLPACLDRARIATLMPDLKHTADGYRKEMQSVIHQPLLNLGNTCWLASSLRCLRWTTLVHLMPALQCVPPSMLRRQSSSHGQEPINPLACRHWDALRIRLNEGNLHNQQDVAECWSYFYADHIPPRLCGRLIHLRKNAESVHCEVVPLQGAIPLHIGAASEATLTIQGSKNQAVTKSKCTISTLLCSSVGSPTALSTDTLKEPWGVTDPPSILALQLARLIWEKGSAQKLTTPVYPSWRIHVPEYDPDTQIILRWRHYRLIAIHLHHGSSLEAGHYTCMLLGYPSSVLSEVNHVQPSCAPSAPLISEDSEFCPSWSAHLNDAKAPELRSITTTEQTEKMAHELSTQGYLYIYKAVEGHDPPQRSAQHAA